MLTKQPSNIYKLCFFIFTIDLDEEDPSPFNRKRKMLLGDKSGPLTKKLKTSPYCVPELTHILAMCEDRIPFLMLGTEVIVLQQYEGE